MEARMNTYRNADDTYEAFVAEFDNAQMEDPTLEPDAFNSVRLKQWVVDAAHAIYDLGVFDALDAVDEEMITGYAIRAGISAGLGYERINSLVEALKEVLPTVEPEDARRQAEEWDRDYYGTNRDDEDDDDYGED